MPMPGRGAADRLSGLAAVLWTNLRQFLQPREAAIASSASRRLHDALPAGPLDRFARQLAPLRPIWQRYVTATQRRHEIMSGLLARRVANIGSDGNVRPNAGLNHRARAEFARAQAELGQAELLESEAGTGVLIARAQFQNSNPHWRDLVVSCLRQGYCPEALALVERCKPVLHRNWDGHLPPGLGNMVPGQVPPAHRVQIRNKVEDFRDEVLSSALDTLIAEGLLGTAPPASSSHSSPSSPSVAHAQQAHGPLPDTRGQ
jgi:hypothetical protein